MRSRGARGFTLIELLIVVAIIGVIAALAVPGLLRARMVASEASAIGSLRTINSAQGTYFTTCGSNGYAVTLADLAKAPAGSTLGFISPDLAFDGITKSGYAVNLSADTGATVITAAADTCNGATRAAYSAYFAETHPLQIGKTMQRSFGTDTRGLIFYLNSGATIPAGMGAALILK